MSETVQNECIDVVPATEFDELLYRVGNHEGKTAVAAFMLSEPNEEFKPFELRHAARDCQGDHFEWVPQRSTFKGYCIDNFAPAGIVTENEGAFRATDLFLPQRLAFCGSILGWSLDFPDTSVQKVFGSSAAGNGYWSPNLRYDICRVIADNAGHEMSLADVAFQIGKPDIDDHAVPISIRALAAQGILKTHTLDVTTDVRLRIVDHEFHKGVVSYDKLDPVTRLAYAVLQDLSAQGKEVIDFDDFRNQALATDPNVNQVQLRVRWVQASSQKARNFPGLERVERTIKDPYKLSTVKLHPAHSEAVNALLHRLDRLQTDGTGASQDGKLTLKIIHDEQAMAQIFAKTQRFSASVARQEDKPEQVKARLLEIIQHAGTISIDAVVEVFAASGRRLTTTAMRRHLNSLMKEEKITRKDQSKDPSSTRIVAHFSAIPETSSIE